MAEIMNTPFGDNDTSAVAAAVSGAKGPDRETVEEITIKFAKGLCSEPFTGKSGKEFVRIQIPNQDPSDHSPWQEFVLGAKQVHENQYGKGLWAKLPADGHTTISRPFLAGKDENGRNVWDAERREVPNRQLKEMVEYYKSRSRDEKSPASSGRETKEKDSTSRTGNSQKAEPEPGNEQRKSPAGNRSFVKAQLAESKKEAIKNRISQAKPDKKPCLGYER